MTFSCSEARFCPNLHIQKGLSSKDVLQAVIDGRARAEKTLGIRYLVFGHLCCNGRLLTASESSRSGLIVCAMRHHPVEESITLAELAVAHRDAGVVGFDIAGEKRH